jgi:hypothetical protein
MLTGRRHSPVDGSTHCRVSTEPGIPEMRKRTEVFNRLTVWCRQGFEDCSNCCAELQFWDFGERVQACCVVDIDPCILSGAFRKETQRFPFLVLIPLYNKERVSKLVSLDASH